MSKEAMKLALEALENAEYGDHDKKELNNAITALREALAEQPAQQWQSTADKCELEKVPANGSLLPAQQEPVAWMQEMPTQEGETRSVRMTTLKEHATLQWGNPIPLYTAPPQHEPVAMRYDFDGYGWKYIDSGSGSDWQTRIKDAEPIYTTPPQRTWVGLTKSEITTSLPYSVTRDKGCFHAGALWAEAKLKEKNT